MSNVFKRNRLYTDLQFMISAYELQQELVRICTSKKIPKKFTYTICTPCIYTCTTMVDNLITANSIYPLCKEDFLLRRNYQLQAWGNIFQLHNKLLLLIECVIPNKVNSLELAIQKLYEVKNLTNLWIKNDFKRYDKLYSI